MPQIKVNDATGDLRATNVGVDATAAAARRGNAFYDDAAQSMQALGSLTRSAGADIAQAGRATADAARAGADALRAAGGAIKTVGDVATDYIAHREISTGAANFAALQEAKVTEWNSIVKNPGTDINDPSIAAKFREESLQPALEEFQKGFLTSKGENWAQSHAIAFGQHMFQKQSADMSTMAGIAIKSNMFMTVNRLANTVRQDPSSAEFAMSSAASSIDAMIGTSPTLSPTDAAHARGELLLKAKEAIAKSWYVGVAEKNPDAAEAALAAGKFNDVITPIDAKAIFAEVKRQRSADRVDENYRRHNDDLQRKQVSEGAENEILKRVYSDDPKVMSTISPKAIANDDRLSVTTKEKLIRLVDREMKPESDARISAQNSRDLFRRIYLPDGDPDKITDLTPINQARIDGGITKADHKDLREEFSQARTPEGDKLGKEREEFFKRYAASIDGAMDYGGHSALGSQKMYLFTNDVRRQEADLRRQGKDPHQLYDPSSPNFVGKQENIAKYHVSMTEAMRFEKEFNGVRPNTNLTGQGKDVTGVQVIEVPRGMSPAEVIKNYKSGSRIRLPDGRIGTVP